MRRFVAVALSMTLAGCGSGLPTSFDAGGQQPFAPGSNHVWFSPNVASPDMVTLFTEPQQWKTARSKVGVFVFYETHLYDDPGYQCPNCGDNTFQNFEQAKAFEQLKAWNIKIGMESGSVKPEKCGVLSPNINSAVVALDNVRRAGSQVDYIIMDEPFVSGIESCHFSVDKTAELVSQYIQAVNASHPEVQIGMVEAYPYFSPKQLESFVQALAKQGVRLPFLHVDMDRYRTTRERTDVPGGLRELQRFCTEQKISFGVIIWGDHGQSPQTYYNDALTIATTVRSAIGKPDQIIFQSWAPQDAVTMKDNLYPLNLPESEPTSHTGIINTVLQFFGE